MPSPSEIPNFNTATHVKQLTSHTYAAHFHTDWCIGSVPHGGYVTSTLQRALSLHFTTTHSSLSQPHLLALHLSFVRRTSVGPALITLHDTKIGRSTSTVHIALSQPAVDPARGDEVVGYATHTNFSSQSGPSFETGWKLDPPPPRLRDVQCLNSGAGDENWVSVAELPFAGFRRASKRCEWFLPRRDNATITRAGSDQWFALNTLQDSEDGGGERRKEVWTNDTLGFVVDMFPQVVETFLIPGVYTPSPPSLPSSSAQNLTRKSPAASYWYPTLLLNMEVKKSLGEGCRWLFLRVVTKKVEKGRYDLEVVVLDRAGEVVVVSQHVCFALGTERNLGTRSGRGEKL